uniref:Uncharacterized protein n=1 Tax=Romanomermis culicivorax TaxID=13658 RepID=A0A915IUI5_ROMCU
MSIQQSTGPGMVTTELFEQLSVNPKKSRKTVKSSEKQNEPAKVFQQIEEPIVEKRTLRSSTRNQKK